MSAPTSPKPGEFVRVPVGTLEAGVLLTEHEMSSMYGPEFEAAQRAVRLANDPAMAANHAALPRPPDYAPPKTYNMVSNV